jgi:hypothetical protein
MAELLEAVILGLCTQIPDFALFFHTHFELVESTSLKPQLSMDGTNLKLNRDVRVKRKDLTEEMKKEYYKSDYALWESMDYVGDTKESNG